jgi:shikimate dehydrogenase
VGIPYAEVIGDPIAHSKSPLIHKFWLEKLGIEGDYRATRVTADELPAYLGSRRADPDWRGCNVAAPHKVSALPLVDGLFPAATVATALNTVFCFEEKLVGNNTDLRGFAEPFRANYEGRGSAIVMGSGGAARAAFVALAALGFGPIDVMSRCVSKGSAMLRALGQDQAAIAAEDVVPAVDLFVNASSMGMVGQESRPLDLSLLPPSAIVYDIVYEPLETPLLAAARERGLRTIDGLTMLVGQAAASFCHFFPDEPPRRHDEDLRELLTQ